MSHAQETLDANDIMARTSLLNARKSDTVITNADMGTESLEERERCGGSGGLYP